MPTRGTGRSTGGRRIAAATLVVALAAAGRAAAQQPEQPPRYRGLFEDVDAAPGATVVPRALAESFSWSAQLFDVSERGTSSAPESAAAGPSSRSQYGALSLAAAWRRTGRSLSLGLGGETRVRYQEWRDLGADRQRLAADLDVRLTRTTRLVASTQAAHLSRYTVSVPLSGSHDPGADPEPAIGAEVDGPGAITTASTLTVSRRLGPRRRLEWGNSFAHASLGGGSTSTNWTASGRAIFDVGRRASLHVGYGAVDNRVSRSIGSTDAVSHELGAGLRWSSAGGATHVELSAAPGVTGRARMVGVGPASPRDWTPTLGAVARFDHAISPRWRIGAAYQRALYSDERYTEPAYVQTVSARLSAAVSPRVRFDLAAARSVGAGSNDTGAPRPPQTLGCAARLNLRLTALVGSYVEYQAFDSTSLMVSGSTLPTEFHRRGLRAGVTLRPGPRRSSRARG